MRRKCIVFILAALLPGVAYTLDVVIQYYAPTFFGIASGPAAPLSRFEEDDADSRFLFPVENKFLALRFGAFALSINAIITAYVEDWAFSSLNLSAGASFYLNRRETSPMRGWYVTLYPVYELPVVTLGKHPFWNWRSALDIGVSADLFGPLYVSFFSRYFTAWRGAECAVFPDIGIAIGLHFL